MDWTKIKSEAKSLIDRIETDDIRENYIEFKVKYFDLDYDEVYSKVMHGSGIKKSPKEYMKNINSASDYEKSQN
jgi:hypothetical protein